MYYFSEELGFWTIHIDSAQSNWVQNATYQFSKSDGAMQSYSLQSYLNSSGYESNLVVHIYRPVFWEVSSVLVLSSIAIVAEVAVVILIIVKYRERKTVHDLFE
jgi:hypothetical protein